MIQNIKTRIRNKTNQFYIKRTKGADKVNLGLRNVYIFFSLEGLLFAALLLITFVAGVNYANNLILGLSFYLASIWLISLHLTFSHVAGLKFTLLDVSLTEAGQAAWVTFKIINPASKPSRQLRLHFDHSDYINNHLDAHMQAHNLTESPLTHASISQRIPRVVDEYTLSLPVMTNDRGKLILPRLAVSSVYPLGIMKAWAYVYFDSPVWVYPKSSEFKWNPKNAFAKDETEHSQLTAKGQNDFDKLDDYQEGESLARVSWQHFARGHGMMTKHFCDPVGSELTLDYQKMPAASHEQKLQQLAYLLQSPNYAEQNFKMTLPNDIGEFGQGDAFIKQCLLRLAKAP